jgi:N-acetylmuramoyl-L-alanine amidase
MKRQFCGSITPIPDRSMVGSTHFFWCRVLQSILLTLFVGCTHLHIPHQRDQAYSSLAEEIPPPHPERLQGRTIVIDPGHGLGFQGAVGKGDLAEADINLGVALYLAEMLRANGARVILTRVKESSADSGEPLDVREDLRSRVEFANDFRADLFISIHHNSSLDQGKSYNAIETYYKMGDEGPSLDIAQAIHRQLTRNLGIPANQLVPGNYFVLRNSEGPAVLGEASYISNPSMAKKLRKREKLLLEAQAYLLGILEYFSSGRPVVRVTALPGDTIRTSYPFLEAVLEPGIDGLPVDISSVSLFRDGEPVDRPDIRLDGDTLRFTPSAPVASGPHRFELSVRNFGGNASNPLRFTTYVNVPAAKIDLRVRPRTIPPDSRSLVLAEALVADETGSPVADGREVVFRIDGPRGGTWIRRTSGGRAGLLFPAISEGRVTVQAVCDGRVTEEDLRIGTPDGSVTVVILRDGGTDAPIGGVTVALSRDEAVYSAKTSPEGYAAIVSPLEGPCTLRTRRKGYHPYGEEIDVAAGQITRIDLGLNPVQEGALFDRTILLDPAHLGRDDELIGRYRRSDLNLQAARHLRLLLEASGTNVLSVRTADVPLSPVHRVVKSVESGSQVHLVLDHSATGGKNRILVTHYPGSSDGERLAELIRQEFTRITGRSAAVAEEASIVMRHTPSPAITVNTRIGSDPPGGSPDRAVRSEAYAVYNALLRFFGVAEEKRGNLRVAVVGEGDVPVREAILVMDEIISLRSDENGEVSFRLLDGGHHSLRAVAEGYETLDVEWFTGIGKTEELRLEMKRTGTGK